MDKSGQGEQRGALEAQTKGRDAVADVSGQSLGVVNDINGRVVVKRCVGATEPDPCFEIAWTGFEVFAQGVDTALTG